MPLSAFHLISSLLLAALACSAAAPVANGADWYVDASATGSSQNGTSWSNAWRRLADISQPALSSGDLIWIKGGTYDERFSIIKGGSDKHCITYLGTGATRPVIRAITADGISDIALLNLELGKQSPVQRYSAITLSHCANILIQDNYVHDTYGGGVVTAYRTTSSHIVVRHNLFSDIGSVDGGSGSSIVILLSGDHNLVEYNSIIRSMDRCRAFGTGVVVRNNFWGPTDSIFYPKANPYPNHTDGFQSYEGGPPLIQFLYERNLDIDNTDSAGRTNAHGVLVQDGIGDAGFNWYILRFNMLIRPGGGAYSFQNVSRTYVYNSTFIAIQHGSSRIYNTAAGYTYPSTLSAATSDLADVRNNTWSFCSNCNDPRGIISSVYLPTHFSSAAQHSYNLGPKIRLPSDASPKNLEQIDPRFTDGTGIKGHDDYTLQLGSPLIEAGAPITRATSLGRNSVSLQVADARRLFDGWGIADADFIKIGSGSYIQIASIDYKDNLVTLSEARSWNDGDSVFVKGSQDIGALPFLYAKQFGVKNTTPHRAPVGPTILSAVCTNPDAIRKVEFLVDGLPVGESYKAPYEVFWTSDGACHKIEARAYSAWASQILTKNDLITINAI